MGLFLHFLAGYVHVFLVMYSVHIPPLDDLFCTHTSSWWPILYIRNFLKAYSVHIPSHIWLFSKRHLYLWCFMSTCAPGDLFCTHTTSWWPILYTWWFFMVPSVHIPPHVDLNSVSAKSYLVCILRNFTDYFVYLLFLGELIFVWVIFHGLHVHVPLFLPILYIYILMVTYTLYKENFNVFSVNIPPHFLCIFP